MQNVTRQWIEADVTGQGSVANCEPEREIARRRFPIGAEPLAEGGTSFRVWAPNAKRIAVVAEDGQGGRVGEWALEAESEGYFSGIAPLEPGDLYRYRLDDSGEAFPDPASRRQPRGPHGPSQVVDPRAFRWEEDPEWAGLVPRGQVLYEMHIGSFTREGTFAAAERELPELARLGITAIELMPVAEFAGNFGWGYDGVALFAPYHVYGTPDDFRRFVQAAHRHGIGVILDVVYNHLGPDGNYLPKFSKDYFTDRYSNEWGAAINFDGPRSGPVREFFTTNARYWIAEFHLDGFRLDATQQIYDASPRHILTEIAEAARKEAGARSLLLVAENEPQNADLARPVAEGGIGLDTLWNDDFHHSAMVALSGRNDAYYTDYLGAPQEFISAIKWGYLYQGQRYKWQRQRRGVHSLDLPPEAFVNFIQNHDQVANSARGERCHRLTAPARLRAMTALLLLAPSTPMLFQGQEFAASTPFLYFADHQSSLREQVAEGRREFLSQFRALARPETQQILAPPHDEQTFLRCKLDFAERERHREVYQMHKDLLALRREDERFREQIPRGVDGAVLSPDAFVLRYLSEGGKKDRLLIVNLGRDLRLDPAPEPLLAPPRGALWRLIWSSEDTAYGGDGTPPVESEENWWLPGNATVVLAPEWTSMRHETRA